MRTPQFLLAMAIAMAAANAAHAQSMVYGMGTVACGDYSGFRSQNPGMFSAAQAWTTGYLTAMTQQLRVDDLLRGIDINGAMKWLDNYCAKNSLENYFTANSQLVIYLARRQGQGN